MTVLEEEEETSRFWNHTTKKIYTRTNHLWSHVYNHMAELFIICRESLIFFSERSRVLLQGHELLRLGARYRLRALNDWDTTGRQQVISRSVGESVHSISIGLVHQTILPPSTNPDRNSGGSKDRPYISPLTSYYMSPEN